MAITKILTSFELSTVYAGPDNSHCVPSDKNDSKANAFPALSFKKKIEKKEKKKIVKKQSFVRMNPPSEHFLFKTK